MKNMTKSIVALSLLTCLPAFADNATAVQSLQQQLHTLSQQVAALEQQKSSTQTAVGLDTALPFGTLSKNQLPEMLQLQRYHPYGRCQHALIWGL